MKINQAGIDLIKSFEGCKLQAYDDPLHPGLITIGYGHTGGVKLGTTITQDQADAFLLSDLLNFESSVSKLVNVSLTDNQFSALVSFAYNLGPHTLQTSSLLKLLNQGHYSLAADEFLKWTHSNGQVVPGLVRRREAERALFLNPSS